MAVIKVKCRYCRQQRVLKNGKAPNGSQRFYCQDCQHSFQVEYHSVMAQWERNYNLRTLAGLGCH